MARRKLNPNSLKGLLKTLDGLPQVVANKTASNAAEKITGLGRATFAAGQNAYGDPWEPGVDGGKVDLKKTGNLERDVKYVANGTKLRAVLGPKYAKYQVGKRQVFPRAGSTLPQSYIAALKQVSADAIKESLGGT